MYSLIKTGLTVFKKSLCNVEINQVGMMMMPLNKKWFFWSTDFKKNTQTKPTTKDLSLQGVAFLSYWTDSHCELHL